MNMLVYLTAQNSSSSHIQQLPLAPPWLSHSTVREVEKRALLLSWENQVSASEAKRSEWI